MICKHIWPSELLIYEVSKSKKYIAGLPSFVNMGMVYTKYSIIRISFINDSIIDESVFTIDAVNNRRRGL